MKATLLSMIGFLLLTGCATSRDIAVNPAGQGKSYKSAYVIIHGGASSDVDASVQRALLHNGFMVTAGQGEVPPEGTDLIVRYSDSWSWDMTMYLKRLDINFYESRSRSMIATATWKNSALHGFPDLDEVVSGLVTGINDKLQ